jgi:hypothetical protein
MSGTCQACGARLPPSLHPGNPRKWCSERCRKTQYSTPCEDCGQPTTGDGSKHRWCKSCLANHQESRIEGVRRRWAPHRVMVEAMWADGLSIKEIRELAGIPTFVPGPYRAHGYDLPHRYRTVNGKRVPEGIAA